MNSYNHRGYRLRVACVGLGRRGVVKSDRWILLNWGNGGEVDRRMRMGRAMEVANQATEAESVIFYVLGYIGISLYGWIVKASS